MRSRPETLYRSPIMDGIRYRLRRLFAARDDERGAVATEYGILLTLIAIVIVVALTLYGGALVGLFNQGPSAFP